MADRKREMLNAYLCTAKNAYIRILKAHAYLRTSKTDRIRILTANAASSSIYWASVANAPNVLQPYWLIVLPLDVPHLTTSPLLWSPSGQRWRCLWTFLSSNVPTFSTSRLQEILAPKVELHGREMADEFWLKIPDFHITFRDLLHAVNLRHGTDGFTSPPKEGMLKIFSPWKKTPNGFGRVWTRDLGYQMSARYL